MTPSDDLQRLVERIEAATEGSRELDAKIALACGPEFAGWIEHPANHGNQYGEVAPSREAFDEWLIRDGTPCLISTPAYTRSLDAALTLVPEGVNIGLHIDHNGNDCAWSSRAVGWQPQVTAGCVTPALALCAAALRARITQEQSNDPSSNG